MFFYAAENIEHFVKYKQVFQPCLPLIYPKKQRPFIIRSKPDKQANKRQKLEKLKKKKKEIRKFLENLKTSQERLQYLIASRIKLLNY